MIFKGFRGIIIMEILNRFAQDVYGFPASSTVIESIFSEMETIITEGRRSITSSHLCEDQL